MWCEVVGLGAVLKVELFVKDLLLNGMSGGEEREVKGDSKVSNLSRQEDDTVMS